MQVVAAPTEEGSFIQLEAQAGTPAALERATGLLALAVKGCLAEPTSPLQVCPPPLPMTYIQYTLPQVTNHA